MNVWWWMTLLVLLALVGIFMIARRSAKARVDPTEVSIDPALAARVRELCAQNKKVQAVKELRDVTGLALGDALAIVDKLAASDPRRRG